MIIDSHQHFWRLSRGDYDWLSPDLGTLYRDYLPIDIERELSACGVNGTVLVQAAGSEAETRFMLELARDHAFILGVVGWVDMEAPDVAQRIEALVEEGRGVLKGVRPMIQGIDDPDWVLSPKLDDAFCVLEERGLTFDALVAPIHLRRLEKRVRKHPDLKVVIDHGAKPSIATGARSEWSADLESISSIGSVYCKLSGLVTEAGQDWSERDLKPYVTDILRHFGPSHVMWGSDWPVLNLAGDYRRWFDISHRLVGALSDQECAQVFGRTAATFYSLDCGDESS